MQIGNVQRLHNPYCLGGKKQRATQPLHSHSLCLICPFKSEHYGYQHNLGKDSVTQSLEAKKFFRSLLALKGDCSPLFTMGVVGGQEAGEGRRGVGVPAQHVSPPVHCPLVTTVFVCTHMLIYKSSHTYVIINASMVPVFSLRYHSPSQ